MRPHAAAGATLVELLTAMPVLAVLGTLAARLSRVCWNVAACRRPIRISWRRCISPAKPPHEARHACWSTQAPTKPVASKTVAGRPAGSLPSIATVTASSMRRPCCAAIAMRSTAASRGTATAVAIQCRTPTRGIPAGRQSRRQQRHLSDLPDRRARRARHRGVALGPYAPDVPER